MVMRVKGRGRKRLNIVKVQYSEKALESSSKRSGLLVILLRGTKQEAREGMCGFVFIFW